MGSSYSNYLMLVCRSKAIFKTPSEEDLGIYSCFVTHTDGASASYTLSEESEFIDLFHFYMFEFTKLTLVIDSDPFSVLFLAALKELLKISHDHKFPSE